MSSLYCIQLALDKHLPNKSLVFPQICNDRKASFKIIGDIAAHILDEGGLKTLFVDLILKFYICMVYTVWGMNQNNAIKNLMEKMNDNSFVCVVII